MKKLEKSMCLFLLTLILIVAAAIPAEAATIKLNHTSVTLIKKQTVKLKVSGTKKKVKWTTSNKSVATVTSKGKVTAKKKGTAVIYAKVSGKKKLKCKIKVESPSISREFVFLNQGDSYQLKLDGASGTVTWKTEKSSLATVSKKGLVTASKTKLGSCNVIAEYKGKKYTCIIKVTNYAKNYETVKDAIATSPRTDADGNKCLLYNIYMGYPSMSADVNANISYLEDRDLLKCSYTSKIDYPVTDSNLTEIKADITTVVYFNLVSNDNIECQVDYYYNDMYLGGTAAFDAVDFDPDDSDNQKKIEITYNDAMLEELKKELADTDDSAEVTEQDVKEECQELCSLCFSSGFTYWNAVLYNSTELQLGDLGMINYTGSFYDEYDEDE